MVGLGDLAENTQDTSDNEIYQNIVWNTGGAGIYFWKSNSAGPMQRNKIFNNVFWANKYEGIMNENLTATQFKDNVFTNNIVAKNGDTGCGLSLATQASNQFRNNLWWSNGDGSRGPGTANLLVDPLLTSVEAGNFMPLQSSPVRDRGTLATGGTPLPYVGATIDIGALEYGLVAGGADAAPLPPDANVPVPRDTMPTPDSRQCMCPCACTSSSIVATVPIETARSTQEASIGGCNVSSTHYLVGGTALVLLTLLGLGIYVSRKKK
jgi:hypothetical protein